MVIAERIEGRMFNYSDVGVFAIANAIRTRYVVAISRNGGCWEILTKQGTELEAVAYYQSYSLSMAGFL